MREVGDIGDKLLLQRAAEAHALADQVDALLVTSAPAMILAGSPGISRTERNVTSTTPSNCGTTNRIRLDTYLSAFMATVAADWSDEPRTVGARPRLRRIIAC